MEEREKTVSASEPDSESPAAARPSANAGPAEDAKIRSASPVVEGARRPNIPVFHREGGIAIVDFVDLTDDGPAYLADERHQHPRRQCCRVEEIPVKDQHSPLRLRKVRRRFLILIERELQQFDLRPLFEPLRLEDLTVEQKETSFILYDSGEVSTSLNVTFLSI